jgi:flagellin
MPIKLVVSQWAPAGFDVSNFAVRSYGSGDVPSSSAIASVVAATRLDTVDDNVAARALADVAAFRARNGAQQSRLSSAAELLAVNKANLEQANSRITDVDVAQESTTLSRLKVLVEAGTAMLSQANLASNAVLKLLG